jgi:predicted transcriptional regulator
MKLAQYLSNKRIPQSDFANRIGVTQVAVSRYVTGLRTPSLDLILKIERATKGAVKPKDWAEATLREAV